MKVAVTILLCLSICVMLQVASSTDCISHDAFCANRGNIADSEGHLHCCINGGFPVRRPTEDFQCYCLVIGRK
ncbi:hypothetical protein RRG08_020902 [Elysia crispata]|uniref:Plethodontid modulating factor n=1 Tax=Elysia crispata TaxID=231223 RepID=A0AAE0Z4L2_9GAST|nr:hypothetical protein RRG08_020902 [Elysia crispata]